MANELPRGLALDEWGMNLCAVCGLPAEAGNLGRFYYIVGMAPGDKRTNLVQAHEICSTRVAKAPRREYDDWVFHVLAQLYDVNQGYRP